MVNILNWLVENTSFKMKNIRLEEGIVDGYYDEWILTINEDEEIWCQEAKYETGYLTDESSVTFVHSDVNSKFVTKNKNANFVEFDVFEDENMKPLSQNNTDSKDKISTELYVNGKRVTDDEEIQKWIMGYREINKKVNEAMRNFWLW